MAYDPFDYVNQIHILFLCINIMDFAIGDIHHEILFFFFFNKSKWNILFKTIVIHPVEGVLK